MVFCPKVTRDEVTSTEVTREEAVSALHDILQRTTKKMNETKVLLQIKNREWAAQQQTIKQIEVDERRNLKSAQTAYKKERKKQRKGTNATQLLQYAANKLGVEDIPSNKSELNRLIEKRLKEKVQEKAASESNPMLAAQIDALTRKEKLYKQHAGEFMHWLIELQDSTASLDISDYLEVVRFKAKQQIDLEDALARALAQQGRRIACSRA